MIPGKQYSIEDILWRLWTRKWLIFVTFVVVSTVTIVVARQLPDRYRADTLIVVVPPSASSVRTATQIRDRLPTIIEEILSRTHLERIIRELHLFGAANPDGPMQDLVDRIRATIQIEIVEGAESFRISYDAETPQIAVQVTERLAGFFLEQNTHDRLVQARETSAFLDTQLGEARGRLAEQEKRIEAYRQLHRNELPAQLLLNTQALQSTQTQIQALDDALNRDRDRHLLLERQRSDLKAEPSLPAGDSSASAGSIGLSAQFETATAELRALELRLTPQHPDVVRAKQLAADLERKVEAEAAQASTAEGPKPSIVGELAKRARMRELQSELELLDQQIESKRRQDTRLRATLQTYQARVDAVPTTEAELVTLTRDYDTVQAFYNSLLAKKQDSTVAEELASRQVGDQFKIADPPRQPDRPISPNRRLIDLTGALGGLALGIGLAMFLWFRDKSMHAESDVRAALGLPVVAFIPAILSVAERRTVFWKKTAFSFAVLICLAVCATAVLLTSRL